MSSIRPLFEKELKNKLALKSSGHTSEETVLLKAFKYFDLDNSGNCSKNEWLKAITKIGITGFTDQNLLELFNLYDLDKSGQLDYKEFVSALYGNSSIASKRPHNPHISQEVQETHDSIGDKDFMNLEGVEQIIDKIRNKLAARGVRGIMSIGRNFRIIDDNNSKTIDFEEFRKAAKDFRFGLNDLEIEKAFVAFDRDCVGEIDYNEFLRVIRGNMNDTRRKLVDQVFDKMDKDNNGYIDIHDIKGVYDARQHPDVKAGKRSEEEILLEFLETFETHHNVIESEAPDNIVTREEWQEYYENVSMSIDDDRYFELMMNNCWRINEHTTSNNEKKGWANKEQSGSKPVSEAYARKRQNLIGHGDTLKQTQPNEENGTPQVKPSGNVLLDKFRQKLLQRGGRGIIGLSRQFKIFDDDNSKSLEFDEFSKALKDFKIDLSPNEVKVLFGSFDRDGQGTIDYDEFLRTVKGEMNDRRKKIVMQAFNKLDSDKSGVVDINDIKYVYNCKNHPDVRSGKKTEEDIYGEFLETFETHHNINKGMKDRRVTREEFTEYYNNISMSIDNDDYFEAMITAAWKLGATSDFNKRAGYANQQRTPQKGKGVAQTAPWGTTGEPTNYSTSSRPQTGKKNAFSTKGDDTLIKFREKLSARGTRGIMGLRRSFNIADDDNSKTINYKEFHKLIRDYRIDLTDEEIKKLFGIFDIDGSDCVNYDEFVRGTVGEMNDFRKDLVTKVFNKLDKNGNGRIELDDIRKMYNAKQHPDVKQGKKTEDEVLAEYLDNFEYHFSILNNNKSKDRSINLEEFIEYYNQISMSIPDDKYFELMMTNSWNVSGPQRGYGKGWRGDQ